MVQNPPEDFPRITPYLLYEDVDAAVDWLTNAFGFTEKMRLKGDDGRANHAEIALADGVVMLGCPGADYQNPKRLGGVTQLVHVYVDEIDRHCEAAKAAGARIVRPPEDQFYGDRRYDAEDPEGHMWSFAEHIRDVGPDEMQQGYEAQQG